MSNRNPRAFTLVELLVVIAIIGLLVALLLPAVQAAREAARRMQCANNMKQIGLAMHLYHDAKKTLPFACGYSNEVSGHLTNAGTWAAFILPQLEQQNVYNLFDFNRPLTHANNRTAVSTIINTYICPSDPAGSSPLVGGRVQAASPQFFNPPGSLGLWYPVSMGPTRDGAMVTNSCIYCSCGNAPSATCYCCKNTTDYGSGKRGDFVGLFGRYPRGIGFAEVRDGLSKTLMAGEALPAQCSFHGAYHQNFPMAGTQIPINTFTDNSTTPLTKWWDACGFKSMHPGGINTLLADGSVRFTSDSVNYQVFNEIGTRDGAEISSLEY
jgi:prepilin-type N-terminal cleavage/methylation domain-containing protein/prepilin-type processing-associated H-X9-DG protein